MNSTAFICKYEDCNLIYENPVTVPCGNSLCQQHLDELDDKFNCPFCFDVHQKPSTSSLAMIKMIDSHFELDPLRKMAKESFNSSRSIIGTLNFCFNDGKVSFINSSKFIFSNFCAFNLHSSSFSFNC